MAGFVAFGVIAGLRLGRLSRADGHDGDDSPADYFTVEARVDMLVVLAVMFGVFAGVYFALEQLRRGPWRVWLGCAHGLATLVGILLIFSPALVLGLAPGISFGDEVADFEAWNAVSATGYVLFLLGQLFFVAVLLDAFRREPDLG